MAARRKPRKQAARRRRTGPVLATVELLRQYGPAARQTFKLDLSNPIHRHMVFGVPPSAAAAAAAAAANALAPTRVDEKSHVTEAEYRDYRSRKQGKGRVSDMEAAKHLSVALKRRVTRDAVNGIRTKLRLPPIA